MISVLNSTERPYLSKHSLVAENGSIFEEEGKT